MMSSNEKLAIAAHLHVLMRRKTGRVTDTEWMASDPAYAAEIIRLAHQKAAEGGHDDLALLADRLQAVMAFIDAPAYRPLAQRVSDATRAHHARALDGQPTPPFEPSGHSTLGDSPSGTDATQRPSTPRYIQGLR